MSQKIVYNKETHKSTSWCVMKIAIEGYPVDSCKLLELVDKCLYSMSFIFAMAQLIELLYFFSSPLDLDVVIIWSVCCDYIKEHFM